MIQTDCYAFKTKECAILNEMLCSHRSCPFYKTKAEAAANAKKYPHIDYSYFRQTGQRIELKKG